MHKLPGLGIRRNLVTTCQKTDTMERGRCAVTDEELLAAVSKELERKQTSGADTRARLETTIGLLDGRPLRVVASEPELSGRILAEHFVSPFALSMHIGAIKVALHCLSNSKRHLSRWQTPMADADPCSTLQKSQVSCNVQFRGARGGGAPRAEKNITSMLFFHSNCGFLFLLLKLSLVLTLKVWRRPGSGNINHLRFRETERATTNLNSNKSPPSFRPREHVSDMGSACSSAVGAPIDPMHQPIPIDIIPESLPLHAPRTACLEEVEVSGRE